jgi:hypothetical protein
VVGRVYQKRRVGDSLRTVAISIGAGRVTRRRQSGGSEGNVVALEAVAAASRQSVTLRFNRCKQPPAHVLTAHVRPCRCFLPPSFPRPARASPCSRLSSATPFTAAGSSCPLRSTASSGPLLLLRGPSRGSCRPLPRLLASGLFSPLTRGPPNHTDSERTYGRCLPPPLHPPSPLPQRVAGRGRPGHGRR